MMNLKRCKDGHFYDADKYTRCPHCHPSVSALDATVAMRFTDLEDDIPEEVENKAGGPEEKEEHTLSLEEAIRQAQATDADLERTVSFYRETLGTEPVVGWLTCIEGKHYGKSFGLRSGRSFIGRDSSNDVALSGDSSISRVRHAIVIYDPKARCFIAQPGESRELFYLNGEILLQNEKLHAYDILTIGKEKLLFIPMCGEKFCWEETKQAKKAAREEETGEGIQQIRTAS